MAQEYKLAGVSALDLHPGHKLEVEVEGISGAKVLLVNVGGKIHALGSRCTHYGAPMAKGVLGPTGRLTCPWHGACFDAKTGDVEDAPALDALPTFEIKEKAGAFYITGDEETIKSSRRKPNIECRPAGAGSTKADGRVVVVGGGCGAIAVIEGLRESGHTQPITVISSEGHLPFDRTKLSKALIADYNKVALRDQAWFDRGSVEWIHGEVTAVDFPKHEVTTKAGARYAYSKLVLATGGTAKMLPLSGFSSLNNVFTLRNLHDTTRISEALGEGGKKMVIIGSSFIGMEVAVATAKNNSVTVVGMEKTPLERVLGGEVGHGIRKLLEAKGVTFHMEAGVDRAEPSARDPSVVGAVHLKDGTKLEADLVILGVGVSPATTFLRDNAGISLEQDGSIRTDDNFAVVGADDAYAIGDIATYPYRGPGGDGSLVRIEHWDVAQNAGRVVAAHIAGPQASKEQFIPVFWSALGAQLRYCGNTVMGWDDLVLQGSSAEGKFVAYYTKGETVVAVASMGMDPAIAQSVELMKLGKMPSKSQVKQGVNLFEIAF
ncbi:Apoptosis-inducing factor 1 [Escovopsis weberi]|uniref:Apoptosis-inducing factor 1 n=1 Tax=Escovopsis weberi TaxID=150374 RepID=A0A0M8N4P2_ESCWE|nr:Apoptosis-inducing factor 1 [Escovopsis weberi]